MLCKRLARKILSGKDMLLKYSRLVRLLSWRIKVVGRKFLGGMLKSHYVIGHKLETYLALPEQNA